MGDGNLCRDDRSIVSSKNLFSNQRFTVSPFFNHSPLTTHYLHFINDSPITRLPAYTIPRFNISSTYPRFDLLLTDYTNHRLNVSHKRFNKSTLTRFNISSRFPNISLSLHLQNHSSAEGDNNSGVDRL